MPQETGETSQYKKALIETGGLVAFDMIPSSFRKFGNWMDRSQYEYYAKNATESDGFDVSGCTGVVSDGIAELNDTTEVIPAARFAVNQHNAETGSTLKFVEVARANIQILGRVYYYITLKAVDEQNNNAQPKLYRAKVKRHRINICDGQTEADRKYTLESFYESPQQTLKRPPKPKSNKRKTPSEPQYMPRSRRPFYKFVLEKKTFFEHYDSPFYDVLRLAKKEWKSFSREDRSTLQSDSTTRSYPPLPIQSRIPILITLGLGCVLLDEVAGNLAYGVTLSELALLIKPTV